MADAPFSISGAWHPDPAEILAEAAQVALALSYLPVAMSESSDERAAQGFEYLLQGVAHMLESLEPVIRERVADPCRQGRASGILSADAEYQRGAREGRAALMAELRRVFPEMPPDGWRGDDAGIVVGAREASHAAVA